MIDGIVTMIYPPKPLMRLFNSWKPRSAMLTDEMIQIFGFWPSVN